MTMPELTATVEKVEHLTANVKQVILRPRGSTRFVFTPGQYVSVVLEDGGAELVRYYSIASAPGADGTFALCVAGEGRGAARLHALDAGDTVRLRGPGGRFRLREPVTRDVVFIATGTGISPLRAMLCQLIASGTDHNIALLCGARSTGDILYRDELEELARTLPRVTFLPTLTRPAPGWAGLRGRVQAHLDRVLDGRTDLDVYVCGHAEMVEDVVTDLKRRGLDDGQIHFEQYG